MCAMAESIVTSTTRTGLQRDGARSRYKTAVRRLLRRVYAVRWKLFPPDYTRTYKVRISGLDITVLPTVFHPSWHFTSAFFANHCSRSGPLDGADVLEVGTGTGVVALSAARRARRVTAVDISEAAVKCASENAQANGLDNKVEVRLGDMFEPVTGERFDVILCNPPYFAGEARNDVERAYFGGPNLEWISRLAREAHDHLKPAGRLVCVFGDAADLRLLVSLVEEQGWIGEKTATKRLPVEELSIWEFKPGKEGISGA
jgi:release factor glutamine methyltransferase